MINRHNLPQDVPSLHALIGELLDIIESQNKTILLQQQKIDELQATVIAQQQVIDAQQQTIREQELQIERLTARTDKLEKALYGSRSEQQSRDSIVKAQSSSRHAHGRRRLPKDLPRVQKLYDLSPAKKVCTGCGSFLSKISDVITEQLEAITTQLYVIQNRRAKYACRKCHNKIVVAPMPLQAIDKGMVGPGLLAEVLVAKYQDHLPLYRQAQRFQRLGLELSRSTLGNWVLAAADLLNPLVEKMQQYLLAGAHIFSDDTPIRVLQRPEGQGKTGRFWIYINKAKDSHPACCIYQYTTDRKAQHPEKFLAHFTGVLQSDGYAGYHKLSQGTAIQSAVCWAHARRYFFEAAQGTAPNSLANQGLAFISRLYSVEAQARAAKLIDEPLYQWRQEQAVPIMEAFWTWLNVHKTKALPKSAVAGAINYVLNNWQALQTYLQQAHVDIDNNRAERGIRPLALGRKNYLFAGSNRGGRAAAIIYSLIETCKLNNINTHTYLKDVLERVSSHPNSKIDELLPYNWKLLNMQKLSLTLNLDVAA